MEQFRGKLELKNAQIDVDLQSNEQDGKAVAVFDAPLSPEIAGKLGCQEMFFDTKGIAREFTGSPGLPLILKDLELVFLEPGEDTLKMRPDIVHCFKIGREKEDAKTSITLHLTFRAHFTREDHLDRIYTFWKEHRTKQTFTLCLDPDQQELPFAGGERVAMSDGTQKNGVEAPNCVDCANDVPMMDGDPTKHASGEPCAKVQVDAGPALAPATTMGGTHQRGRRRGPEAVN